MQTQNNGGKWNDLQLKSTELQITFKVLQSVEQNCLTGDDEPVLRGKRIFFRLAWHICHKNRRRNEILTALFLSESTVNVDGFVLEL